MRRSLLSIVVTSALAAVPFASFAQTSGDTTEKSSSQSVAPAAAPAGSMESRYGSSPRCEAMIGADKEQCLRDEAEKTQGSQPDDKAAQGSAGSGSTSPATPAASDEAPKASSTTGASPAEKQ
jgi:hypothetical protein